MFEKLGHYSRIIVTGPHRSGTTIAAQMIGYDTGHPVIMEESFRWRDAAMFRMFFMNMRRAVFQAPAMFHAVLNYPDAMIVMMHRPIEQIRASQARMYRPDGSQLSAQEQNEAELASLGLEEGEAAVEKYRLWETYKQRLPHHLDVNYLDLALHPLWVDHAARREHGKSWHHRRTH